jgi:hypothetical protein
MFKRRSRSIAFLVILSLVVLLALPLAAKEEPKPKPELWQLDGIVAAMGDERAGVGAVAIGVFGDRGLDQFDR